jgi:hypothetical protein
MAAVTLGVTDEWRPGSSWKEEETASTREDKGTQVYSGTRVSAEVGFWYISVSLFGSVGR